MAVRRTPGPPRLSLLADEDLARWHANVARGSSITADVYARRLAAFCEQTRTGPTEIANLPERRLRDVLLDFVTQEERKGRAGSYIQSSVKAVKSWLLHNGVRLSLPVRIRGASDTPTLREERTPTQEELRRILLAGTTKDRVSSALMAFAGLRPEVIGNYRGNDGLRLGDLKDLEVGPHSVSFHRLPALIEVRKELSKADHRYFTFLAEEGCQYVRQYLEERQRGGERLRPETDLIHPKGAGGFHDKAFVTTINVGDGVRKAIRAAGFPWRPYVLRAYFDTQLLLAESRGKLAHDYRVFWMGHKGSMEARYTTNKGRLPKELLEDMYGAYHRCEPLLSTTPSGTERSESEQRFKRLLLRVAGYSDAELDKLAWSEVTDEQIEKLVAERVGRSAAPQSQQVVPIGEVELMLAAGWEYVALLGPDKAILKAAGAVGSPQILRAG